MEMKRYIRTEEGLIIDRDKEAYPFMIVDDYIDFNSYGMFKIKSTADTIEELCDRFVLVDEDDTGPVEDELIGKRYSAVLNEFKFRIRLGVDPCEMNLYGAIWTDKGLIYIMKMNDKGEFELL